MSDVIIYRDKSIGLKNTGNICHLNSFLQLMARMGLKNNFYSLDYIKNLKEKTLRKFFYDMMMYMTTTKPIEYEKIRNFLRNNKNMEKQQDIEETMTLFINSMNEKDDEWLKKIKIEINEEIYEYNDKNIYIHVNTVNNIHYNLRLDIEGNTLKSCLDNYFKVNERDLNKNNVMIKQKTQNFFNSFPEVLIIILNRATNNSISQIVKNDEDIYMPEEFSSNYLENKCNISDDIKYKLIGLSNHRGSTCNTGHYTASIKYDNEWYLYNDDKISKITNINDYINKGYIYIYKKETCDNSSYYSGSYDSGSYGSSSISGSVDSVSGRVGSVSGSDGRVGSIGSGIGSGIGRVGRVGGVGSISGSSSVGSVGSVGSGIGSISGSSSVGSISGSSSVGSVGSDNHIDSSSFTSINTEKNKQQIISYPKLILYKPSKTYIGGKLLRYLYIDSLYNLNLWV